MSMPTRVAILAGGFGTRIRALAGDTPKVLLQVEGRPFLAHLLEQARSEGMEEAVLLLGHASDTVWESAREHCPEGLELVASREENPLGTGGALRLALPHLGDACFVLNGDTYLPTSFSELDRFHVEREAAFTAALVRSDKSAEKGTVQVSPEGDVLRFDEKVEEGTGLINGGVYRLDTWILTALSENEPISLEREILPGLLARDARLAARIVDDPFVDIGLPEDYLRVRERLPRRGGA